MKPGITPRSIALCFILVLGLYLAIFYAMEYSNRRKGPWAVNFVTDAFGNPSITIYQPKLNISSVEIIFAAEKIQQTNLSQRLLFDHAFSALPVAMPFGEVIYEDLRSMPGVITFNFFGHEVELLPRALIVNKKEIPWKSELVLELSPKNKPPQPPKPPKGWEQSGAAATKK